MKKSILAITILLALFTACVTDNPSPIVGEPRSRTLIGSPGQSNTALTPYTQEATPTPVSVLSHRPTTTPAKFETQGIHLGAWLLPSTQLNRFVAQSGHHHGAFVYQLTLCQPVPTQWVLQCIAAKATPIFMVHPPQNPCPDTPIGDTIGALAQALGAFNIPMFIGFYPPGHGLVPAEYALIFRYARAIFMAYAPQAAFVWVAPSLESTIRNPFFPGSDAVDWVGVSLFARRNAYDFVEDVLEAFAPFYHGFTHHHPVMVLPLGVSHFSTANHAYRIGEAAAEILRVYQGLAAFPRVGLIAYGDAFGIAQTRANDFAITVETTLMAAYEKAANSLALATGHHTAQGVSPWLRSPYWGYYLDGNMYVDTATLDALGIATPRQTVSFNDRVFVAANTITAANIRFCPNLQAILVDE